MASELSPQAEAFISDVVARGVYPSRDAVLETAIEALRRQFHGEQPAPVPAEHLPLILEAIAELDAGLGVEMTADDWKSIREEVRSRTTDA